MIEYAKTAIEKSGLPLSIVECPTIGGFLIRHKNPEVNYKMIRAGIDDQPTRFVNYNKLWCDLYRPNGRYESCLFVPQHPTNVIYDMVLLSGAYNASLVGSSYWADVKSTAMGPEEALSTCRIAFMHHDTDLTLIAIGMRKSLRLVTHHGELYEYITAIKSHPIYMPHIAVSRMLSNPKTGFMINPTQIDIDAYIEAIHANN